MFNRIDVISSYVDLSDLDNADEAFKKSTEASATLEMYQGTIDKIRTAIATACLQGKFEVIVESNALVYSFVEKVLRDRGYVVTSYANEGIRKISLISWKKT